MKFVRFQQDGKECYGTLDDRGNICVHTGDMYGETVDTGATIALDKVRLLPPCTPGAMIALWNNSKQQITKLGRATPKETLWLLKPASSFIAHDDDIVYPSGL